MNNKINTINLTELKYIVETSYSFNEVINKCGLKHGGYINKLKIRLNKENIKTEHFIGSNRIKNKKVGSKNKYTLDELLKKNNGSLITSGNLKKKLIKANILENKCMMCNIGNIWNNKLLILQLDHIDGDHDNNELKNLRLLCPNCHSQTDTWCRKKINNNNYIENIYTDILKELPYNNIYAYKLCFNCQNKEYIINNKDKLCSECLDKKNQQYCKECSINEISKRNKSKLCKICLGKSKIKYDGLPTLEQLEKDVKELNYTQTGKKYGVSDNTIRKWLIKLKTK